MKALAARRGHFLVESGLHADTWLDLDALFVDPRAIAPDIDALATLLAPYDPRAICGPLVGGAFVAQAIATTLGVRFHFTRPGPPRPEATLYAATYVLSDASLPLVVDERIAIVDDVISAGSSVRATEVALRAAGADVVVAGALMVLGRRAVDHFAASGLPLVADTFEPFESWTPDRCPLCAAGVALVTPAN